MLTTLVHRHFGDDVPTLKYGGRDKWNHISNAYNEMGKGVFEKANAITLNAKWRNIIYRAKIMKEPHPLGNSKKDIIDEKTLQYRISQLKLNSQYISPRHNLNAKNCDLVKVASVAGKNDSSTNDDKRMKLSDVKKEFGIGMVRNLLHKQ